MATFPLFQFTQYAVAASSLTYKRFDAISTHTKSKFLSLISTEKNVPIYFETTDEQVLGAYFIEEIREGEALFLYTDIDCDEPILVGGILNDYVDCEDAILESNQQFAKPMTLH